MDPVSLTLGVAPIALSLLTTCLEGYRFLSDISTAGEEAQILLCRLHIEENRLRLWAEDLQAPSVSRSSLDEQLEERNIKSLVILILANTCALFTNVKKLRTEYGLSSPSIKSSFKGPSGPDAQTVAMVPSLLAVVTHADPLARAVVNNNVASYADQAQKSMSFIQKTRFVLKDKQKFSTMLEQLRYFNDSLIGLLPPPRRTRLDLTLSSQILGGTENLQNLLRIKEASHTNDLSLSSSAMMKKSRLEIEQPSQTFISASELRCQRKLLSLDDTNSYRSLGMYGNPDSKMGVLVEWKEYDRNLPREVSVDRIQDIARYLHATSAHRSPELPVPECIGYLEDIERSRCCLIYKLPDQISSLSAGQNFKTLADVIPPKFDATKTPSLEHRLSLARILAVAVFRLHVTGWLHKGIRSTNVAFFSALKTDGNVSSNAIDTPADLSFITRPTLIGFDYSRPNRESAESDWAPHLLQNFYDAYTHPGYQNGKVLSPDTPVAEAANGIETLSLPPLEQSIHSQKRYKVAYDIYSFGLILIEIALWQPVTGFFKRKHTVQEIQGQLRKMIDRELGHMVGTKYRDVVLACLNWDRDHPEGGGKVAKPGEEFLKYVVNPLQDCP
ncbi:prion-inhibition and propagation-domain-containing protein [Xylariales sp. PMI_506]|nr:prion-inhibition and propagation-domain-containing protein [Xylariales sp. PMI_506]